MVLSWAITTVAIAPQPVNNVASTINCQGRQCKRENKVIFKPRLSRRIQLAASLSKTQGQKTATYHAGDCCGASTRCPCHSRLASAPRPPRMPMEEAGSGEKLRERHREPPSWSPDACRAGQHKA